MQDLVRKQNQVLHHCPPVTKYKLKVISKYSFIVGKNIWAGICTVNILITSNVGRSEAFTNQNAAKTFYWNTFKKYIYIYIYVVSISKCTKVVAGESNFDFAMKTMLQQIHVDYNT